MAESDSRQGGPMKVLHYVAAFSQISDTFIYDLITCLENGGECSNAVVTQKRTNPEERPFEDVHLVKDDSTILKQIHRAFHRGGFQLRLHRKFYDIIASLRPDMLHCHFGPNGLRMFDVLRRYDLKIPMVVSFHGKDVNSIPRTKKQYVRFLKELFSSERASFTVPSDLLRDRLLALGAPPERTFLIHNSVHPAFLRIAKGTFHAEGQPIRFINVGRLTEMKGQIVLLRAFKQFLHAHPDSRLTIAGSGSLLDDLVREAAMLGIGERTTFAGNVPHKDLPALIAAHDAYVHSSIISEHKEEESFGIAAFEAMAVGLPAVVTNTGAFSELMTEGCVHVIAQQKSPESLAASMEQVVARGLMSPETCRKNREFVRERFGFDHQVEQVLSLYRSMVSSS
jgi:glycosyltransferase involved in cell wall biosynthesis